MGQLVNEVFRFLIVQSVSISLANLPHNAFKLVPYMVRLAPIVLQSETTINHRLCWIFRLLHRRHPPD